MHTPSQVRPPKRVGRDWPFVSAMQRGIGDEDGDLVEEELEEVTWTAGDIGECCTMHGVPMASLGMDDIAGSLTGLPPGVWFKVRVDEVEHVWPGELHRLSTDPLCDFWR